VALTVSATFALSLTACSLQAIELDCDFAVASTDKAITKEVAVVEAPTSNFNKFDNVIDEAKADIRAAISDDGAQLSVIVADAQPQLVSTSYTVFDEGDAAADRENVQKRAYGAVVKVGKCALSPENLLGLEAETDLLAALGSAADTFTNEGSVREIFMLSNGIQTAGQFPMQRLGIPSIDDAAAAVSKLKDVNALPDLKGATVNWIGLGQTDSIYQRSLNQQTVDALEHFWTLIIEESNGTVGKIDREVVAGDPGKYALGVSTISGLKNACFFTLGAEAGFNFAPSSPEFVDEALARVGARSIVEKVTAAGCSGDIHVTGYVASGVARSDYVVGNAEAQQLSLDRAEAFKALLIGEGLDGTVTAHGGGHGPENDWDADGAFNEEAGKLNRIVVISQ
jgi:hypothetical protein